MRGQQQRTIYHPESVGRAHDARWVAYASSGLWQVPGWANSLTLYLFAEADRVQRELGVEGHLGEIGVYHGRTLIALAMLARPGEVAVGVDGFSFADGTGGGYGPVQEHIRRFLGPGAAVRLLKADSRSLSTADLIEGSRGQYRLFHVDGAHDAKTVAHDLALGAEALVGGGLLVADDVFNERFPGVNDATRAFVEGQPGDGFVPFLLGGSRAFLARREFAQRYFAAMRLNDTDYDVHDDTFIGHPVRCIGYPAGTGRHSGRRQGPRWLRAYRRVRQQVRMAGQRLQGRKR